MRKIDNDVPLPSPIDCADVQLDLDFALAEAAQTVCAALHEIDLLLRSTLLQLRDALKLRRPHRAALEFGLQLEPFVHHAFAESAALSLQVAAADAIAAYVLADIVVAANVQPCNFLQLATLSDPSLH